VAQPALSQTNENPLTRREFWAENEPQFIMPELEPFTHENPLLDDNFWASVKQSDNGLNLVREAIANGADVNELSPRNPPLVFAIYNGPLAAVPVLIAAGADVNLKSSPNSFGSKADCNSIVGGLGTAIQSAASLDKEDAPETEIVGTKTLEQQQSLK